MEVIKTFRYLIAKINKEVMWMRVRIWLLLVHGTF